ncbi:hypothetical protein [Paenibacillus sp. P32E]|uniref:hypothetical protein n=1 Tax=Paenibacillus sp. P32E TaxID=1349434 RepID=UPI00095AE58A|nr:hypothetical protein [Paenibacillus sp. P32E]OKP90172.1 hypothetical protein A3848_12495 [Paenibacillus sp. P32E]
MASTKLIFNVDEVQRLRTKIGQVSQDTNQLYLQLKGQANNWSGIPLGQNLVQAQVLINELTVEAEKLEDLIRSAVQGVQNVQEENKRQASQLTQPFSLFAGMLGSFGGNGSQGRYSIPTFAQKAATKLISSIAALIGRDELDSDPMVRNLRDILQKSGLGTVEGIAAQSKLNDINEARNLIAKAQTAYGVYETFGNQTQMDAMHKLAEDACKKLESLGVDKAQYEAGKELSVYFKQSALKACDYDPSSTTSSVPLLETEEYALLLQMSRMEGTKGDWAKQQLALMKPQATIGPSEPSKQVSDEEILNRDNPEVVKRLKETYWFTLSTEEQDRIYAETKAYYEKQEKEAADKNRLLRSGVGNQTLANILEGGSNILVNAIDTASYGMAGTITDWTMGPKPVGYVDPTDNPYGKNAGQLAGNLISIGLPLKYLNSVKTSGAVGNFSPTLMKSVVAGAISGTVGEAFDAFNDFRDDGKQSLGERIAAVGINTVIAGAGDLMITAGSKVAASTMRFVRGKLPDIKVEKIDVAGKASDEAGIKAKEIKETRIEDMGKGVPKFDPLSNPKIATEIEANPASIYGYSPKKGSPLDKFGVDWTDPKQVAFARTKRMEYLQNMEQKKIKLENEVAKLQSEGMSIEDIAKMKVEQRNSDRMQSYIDSNNYDGLAAMKERNTQQYGRPEGPTPEQLFAKYGSWDEVIYSSVRTSPAMDVLTGLYKQ